MTECTPGPWRVIGCEPTPTNTRFGLWDVDGKSNVASSCTHPDACLIAAAPELLASIIELLGPLERASAEMVATGKAADEHAEAAFDRARAAIAKARGEVA